VPNRSRFAPRLTLWLFAAALALKSAVPMLAVAAAGLQGKAVAEICDVYGVATVSPAVSAASAMAIATTDAGADMHGHEAGGEHDHMHGRPPGHTHAHMHAPAAEPAHASVAVVATHDDAPRPAHRHGGAVGDHCALTGMVAIGSGGEPALASVVAGAARAVAAVRAESAVFDAVARWAALLEHGPPVFS
jgi:hypothetical protein